VDGIRPPHVGVGAGEGLVHPPHGCEVRLPQRRALGGGFRQVGSGVHRRGAVAQGVPATQGPLRVVSGSVGLECEAQCHTQVARLRQVCHRAHVLYPTTGKEHLIVGVYVGDLIITEAWEEDINGFKREMVACFCISDLGLLSCYLDR